MICFLGRYAGDAGKAGKAAPHFVSRPFWNRIQDCSLRKESFQPAGTDDTLF